MSMLSSQCNKLRGAATILEDEGVMPACAKLLRDAADTIWELRCKLAGMVDQRDEIERLESENARLHEYVTKLEQANIALDSDNAELRNDMSDMQMIVSDNRKLREFATLAWQILTRNEPMFVWQGMVEDARELGIEVDDA